MGEFDPRAVDWGRAFAEAVAIASRQRPREAEDIVQQGMTALLEGGAPFDPDGEETLPEHLVTVGLREKRNRERTERRRRRPNVQAKMQQWFDDDRPPSPEELSEEMERRRRALDALRDACKDNPDAREIVRLEGEGENEPAKQAQVLKWPIERVRNARKRVARRVQEVADAGDEDEEQESEPP